VADPPVYIPTTFPGARSGPSAGYVNSVTSSMTAFDFTFSFTRTLPPTPDDPEAGDRVELVSQVTMSPQYAKSLAALLESNIAQYESRFGSIAVAGEGEDQRGE